MGEKLALDGLVLVFADLVWVLEVNLLDELANEVLVEVCPKLLRQLQKIDTKPVVSNVAQIIIKRVIPLSVKDGFQFNLRMQVQRRRRLPFSWLGRMR